VQKYWYDANGNQTQRISGTLTFNQAYDVEGRLNKVTGGATAGFGYDGDGKRITATFGANTTVYIGDYYEKTGATVKTYYHQGGQRVATCAPNGVCGTAAPATGC